MGGVHRRATVWLPLTGGDKLTQQQDIARAADGPRTQGDKAVTMSYRPFDAADYLDNDEVIAEYLSAAVEDPDPNVFLAALGDVAKARGMAQIAEDAGLGREGFERWGASSL